MRYDGIEELWGLEVRKYVEYNVWDDGYFYEFGGEMGIILGIWKVSVGRGGGKGGKGMIMLMDEFERLEEELYGNLLELGDCKDVFDFIWKERDNVMRLFELKNKFRGRFMKLK